MRTIKFRAWDEKNKDMAIYEPVRFEEENMWTWDAVNPIPDNWLMQYIGRNDCQGNEVYDGDIFKDSTYVYIVYWDDNACGFKVKKKNYSGKLVPPIYSNIESVLKNLVVCGNIHENQELL